MDSNKLILKALAEMRRRQILAIKLNPATEDIYPDAYVFAVLRSFYPLYDENIGFLEDRDDILEKFPFTETYDISREQMEEVVKLIEEWLEKNEPITFRTLEGKFYNREDWNKKWRNLRIDLINICRYLYLHGEYDDIWEAFLDMAPSEAKRIAREWNPDELLSSVDV